MLGMRVMSKKQEGEPKKTHIDDTTVKGVVKIAAITAVITEIITKMMDVLFVDILQRLLIYLLLLYYKMWFLPILISLVVMIITTMVYTYKWIKKRNTFDRNLSRRSKRLERATELEEKLELQKEYIDLSEKHRKETKDNKKQYCKKMIVQGRVFCFFCLMSICQCFLPVQTVMSSGEMKRSTNSGINGIITELIQENESRLWDQNADIDFILEELNRLLKLSSEQIQVVFYVTLDEWTENENEVHTHNPIERFILQGQY